jgi:hypothetical protein
MFIPDPNFSILDLGFRAKKAQDPGSGSVRVFYGEKIVIKVPDTGSGIFPITDPGFWGSRGPKSTESRARIRKTD